MSTLATGDDAQTWFESLEEGQCILKQQSIAISQNLTRINEVLECLTRQHGVDETMVHGGDTSVEVSSTTSSVTVTKWQKLKPSQPSEFNGNCTKGCTFINSCMLYTVLCLEEFTNDIQQVCWVLTIMKKDRAAIFTNCMTWSENQTGLPCFQTWESFYTTYVLLFCPINKSTMALMKLETEEYHQNKCNVNEYVNDFEELINLSGYTDPLAIVIKFC
jgi:hypothetical protein